MRIVKAENVNDYETIEILADEIWRGHYTDIIGEKQVGYMLDRFQSVCAMKKAASAGAEYYIIESDGAPSGYFAVFPEKNRIYLDKLYVADSFRRKGCAKAALNFIEKNFLNDEVKCVYLTVNKRNAGSIAAYKRLGFKVESPWTTDIGGGFCMDDFQMYKFY